MNTEMIAKTEAFLKNTFTASTYLQSNLTDRDYRLEHSYRVGNIAKTIAEAEGFDVTSAVIAGLLHDIAYCEEMVTREDRMNHGRRSAAIARPFLENLGLSADVVNEICYGIAIHVDISAILPDYVRTYGIEKTNEILRMFGVERLIFATDYPDNRFLEPDEIYGLYFDILNKMDFTSEEAEMISYGNIGKILNRG